MSWRVVFRIDKTYTFLYFSELLKQNKKKTYPTKVLEIVREHALRDNFEFCTFSTFRVNDANCY